MGVRIITCYEVTCDGCEEPWGGDYGPALHFDSVQDAYAEISQGWRLYPDGQLLCPRCSCKQDCAQLGHCWTPLPACACAGTLTGHESGCPDLYLCGHCDIAIREVAR